MVRSLLHQRSRNSHNPMINHKVLLLKSTIPNILFKKISKMIRITLNHSDNLKSSVWSLNRKLKTPIKKDAMILKSRVMTSQMSDQLIETSLLGITLSMMNQLTQVV